MPPIHRNPARAFTAPPHHSKRSRCSLPSPSVANRRTLLFSLSPFLILATFCLCHWGQQTLSQKGQEPLAQMTAAQARQIASTFCTRASSQPYQVVATTRHEQVLPRKQEPVRLWEVECESRDHRLVLQINADTEQITQVNRYALDGTTCLSASGEAASRAEVERQARFYLSLMRIASSDLEPVRNTQSEKLRAAQAKWTFQYRRKSSSGHRQMISVSVDKISGALIDVEIHPSS